MRTYTAVVERDPDTGMYVGYIPAGRVPILKASPSMSSRPTSARWSNCSSPTASRSWRRSL